LRTDCVAGLRSLRVKPYAGSSVTVGNNLTEC
jgi:hypothetical protein